MSPHSSPERGRIKDRTRETAEIEPNDRAFIPQMSESLRMRFFGRSVLGVDQTIFCARSHAHELHCGRLSSSYGYKFFLQMFDLFSRGYKCGFEKVVLM